MPTHKQCRQWCFKKSISLLSFSHFDWQLNISNHRSWDGKCITRYSMPQRIICNIHTTRKCVDHYRQWFDTPDQLCLVLMSSRHHAWIIRFGKLLGLLTHARLWSIQVNWSKTCGKLLGLLTHVFDQFKWIDQRRVLIYRI